MLLKKHTGISTNAELRSPSPNTNLVFHLEASEDKGALAIRYDGNYYLAVDTEGQVKLYVSQSETLCYPVRSIAP